MAELVFLQASKAGHPFDVMFAAWFQRKFRWAISHDILTEYEKMLSQRSGRQWWLQFSRVLDLADAREDLRDLHLANRTAGSE
jgi:hypothetical protein